MSEYTIRRNIHGYATAIERDGYTILQLNDGSERNEEHIKQIVATLNEIAHIKAERDALRTNVTTLRFKLGLVRTDIDTVYRALFQYDFHHGEAKKLGNIIREIDSTFEQLKSEQPKEQGDE